MQSKKFFKLLFIFSFAVQHVNISEDFFACGLPLTHLVSNEERKKIENKMSDDKTQDFQYLLWRHSSTLHGFDVRLETPERIWIATCKSHNSLEQEIQTVVEELRKCEKPVLEDKPVYIERNSEGDCIYVVRTAYMHIGMIR